MKDIRDTIKLIDFNKKFVMGACKARDLQRRNKKP